MTALIFSSFFIGSQCKHETLSSASKLRPTFVLLLLIVGGVWPVAIATAAAAVADDVTKSREPHWLRSSHVTIVAPQQVCYVHNRSQNVNVSLLANWNPHFSSTHWCDNVPYLKILFEIIADVLMYRLTYFCSKPNIFLLYYFSYL